MLSPQAEALLAFLRDAIQRHRRCIVPCDQLLVLAPRDAPIRSQFAHIFTAAEKENWSVEFRPDGSVCFAEFQAAVSVNVIPADDAPGLETAQGT